MDFLEALLSDDNAPIVAPKSKAKAKKASNYFSGRVFSVVYENPPEAFYIVKLLLDPDGGGTEAADPLVVVKGTIPGLQIEVGTWFGFEANWVRHEKYGPQLSITRAPVLQDGWTAEVAYQMLLGHGVGVSVMASMRDFYKADDAFLEALEDLEKVKASGVTNVEAEHLAQTWQYIVAYFKALTFLTDLGLPKGVVGQVWSLFGDAAINLLSKNPWALVQIPGIRFDQVDEVARRLNLDMESPDRVRGAVLYLGKNNQSFGHLFMQTGALFEAVRGYVPSVTKMDIGQALVGLHKEGLLVLDRYTRPGLLAVYDPWNYKLEKDSAEHLYQRVQKASLGVTPGKYMQALGCVGPATQAIAEDPQATLLDVAEAAITEWGQLSALVLAGPQKQGVINALVHPVSLLTGLPGTGKTTSLRAVVSILQDAHVPFLLCAPTGIAAKRLSELTGAQAHTIHRAFAAKGKSNDNRQATYAGIVGTRDDVVDSTEDGVWEYGPDNPHPAEVVIVDESSMVDQHLLFRLLDCTQPTCRLVFVGDDAQLPSVGPGNVLRDMLSSGLFPMVKLVDIFRQKDTSDIVYAAHAIHRGDIPKTDAGSDFTLIPVANDEAALEFILKLGAGLYTHRKNFQILSPRHAGAVGVTNLNEELRSLLNPQQPGLQEVKMGKDTLREDDRVMVVKNRYDGVTPIFNGDVGKIARVIRKDKVVEIKIFGEPPMVVPVPFKILATSLRLAYACTVHKAQGLEYDQIIMPLMDSFRHQLQRNLLYTAVTRARKKVILVGTRTALASAVLNNKEEQRNTLFPDRLARLFQSQVP